MTPAEQPLPTTLRAATLLALVCGALVGSGALRDLVLTAGAATAEVPTIELGPLKGLLPDEKVYADAMRASMRAQLTAMESMETFRVLILGGLAVAASLVSIFALRLRWPLGERRGGLARLLAGASVVTAILRTFDGAQMLAIVRRGVQASEKVLATTASELRGPEGFSLAMASALSVGTTILTVATFLVLSSYFRGETATKTFAALDRDLPEDDDEL